MALWHLRKTYRYSRHSRENKVTGIWQEIAVFRHPRCELPISLSNDLQMGPPMSLLWHSRQQRRYLQCSSLQENSFLCEFDDWDSIRQSESEKLCLPSYHPCKFRRYTPLKYTFEAQVCHHSQSFLTKRCKPKIIMQASRMTVVQIRARKISQKRNKRELQDIFETCSAVRTLQVLESKIFDVNQNRLQLENCQYLANWERERERANQQEVQRLAHPADIRCFWEHPFYVPQ